MALKENKSSASVSSLTVRFGDDDDSALNNLKGFSFDCIFNFTNKHPIFICELKFNAFSLQSGD